MTDRILIGTQGWTYPAWVGPFYPVGSSSGDMLATYTRAFPTVEVDSTFDAAPTDAAVRSWRQAVPEGFRLSLKVPQEITHERRLVGADDALDRFVARARGLGDRLGALLLQMPSDWRPTPATRDALSTFLARLPKEFEWAVEFRDPRWLTPETRARLSEHGVAIAIADGRWIRPDVALAEAAVPTAPFAYLRWMGRGRRITDYTRVRVDRTREIDRWSRVVRALAARVGTVFGYFHNQYQGHGPQSARSLQVSLGQPVVEPASLRLQTDLTGAT